MSRQRNACLSLLLATTVLGVGCAPDPEVAKREYLLSGDQYAEQEQYAEAVIEYRNAVQQDPRFGEARYKLAEAYREIGDVQGAYGEYIRAADLLPNDLDAQLMATRMLVLSGQFEDARARADRALAIDSQNVDALMLKGNALAGLSEFDEAVTQVEAALREDPDLSGGYSNLGFIELARGNQPEAEYAFQRAIEVAPDSVQARLAYANFLWTSGRRSDAEAALLEAYEADHENLDVNRALATFFLGSGRAAEAEPHLKAVAEISGDEPAQIALGEYYIGMRRYEDARAVLEALRGGDGDTAVAASVRLAVVEAAAGDKAAASSLIDDALGLQPDNQEALVAQSLLLFESDQREQALESAQKAVEVDPDAPGPHLVIARIQTSRREFEEAEAAYNQVLRINPSSTLAQLELSRVKLALGSFEEARDFAQAAVDRYPNSGDAHFLLAQAHLALGNIAEAEPPLRLLAEAVPNSARVLTEVGRLEMAKGNLREARDVFERATELSPSTAGALMGLVAIDLRENQPERGRARIERRLADDPENPALLLLAGRTYASVGDLASAETALRKVVELDEANLQAYQMLGALYVSQRRLDDARLEFEEIASRRPTSVAAHTLVGMVYHLKNDLESARSWYEKTLQIERRAGVAANNLAWLHTETGGNLDVALQLAQTAKSELPASAEVDDTLGWIYYKKELYSLAISAFEESIEKDADNPVYHYHLGLAYAQSGASQKASQSLRQALELNPDFDGAEDARQRLSRL